MKHLKNKGNPMSDEFWSWVIVLGGTMLWVGWVLNIIQVFKMSYDIITFETIIRLAGVPLFPIGGLLGYWF
jgi:hypothetical protein